MILLNALVSGFGYTVGILLGIGFVLAGIALLAMAVGEFVTEED